MIQLSLCWKFKQPVFISSKSPCVLHGKIRPKPASPPLPRVCGWKGQHDGFAPEAQLRHGSVENWATKNERKRSYWRFCPPPHHFPFLPMTIEGKGSNHPNFIIFHMKKKYSTVSFLSPIVEDHEVAFDLKGHKLAVTGTHKGSQSRRITRFLHWHPQVP